MKKYILIISILSAASFGCEKVKDIKPEEHLCPTDTTYHELFLMEMFYQRGHYYQYCLTDSSIVDYGAMCIDFVGFPLEYDKENDSWLINEDSLRSTSPDTITLCGVAYYKILYKL